jgi:hypothetical protein
MEWTRTQSLRELSAKITGTSNLVSNFGQNG